MDDCIFCKIISGDIPSDIVYRDDEIIAFRDVNPVAPTHILVVPVSHINTVADVPETGFSLVGDMMKIANQLARQEEIADSGYRLVINCGGHGGQLVQHLHLHLVGGRQLSSGIG
jgi:histidine triad (HIT) family protein